MRPASALAALMTLPALAADPATASNPFFAEWKTPFGVPPFAEIREDHFLPAFREGMARQKAEVAAIADAQEPPTFANTILALDQSGQFMDRIGSVFFNLTGAETNPRLQAVNREVMPLLAAHRDDINLNAKLFQRVKAVWDARATLKLAPDQARLLERTYKGFVRSGAALTADQQTRMRAINAEQSKLGVDFGDRLLKATKAFQLVVEKPTDLAGLPEGTRMAAAAAAKKAGKDGQWLFTLDGPSIWPFLEYAQNRELRKRILTGYLERCNQGGDTDTNAIVAKVAALRVEKAQLLGYKTWADYVLEENMAKDPKGVYGLLEQIWKPALEVARKERAELQAMMAKDLPGQKLEPWDWRYYAEKVKQAKYDFDEESVKPYFAIDAVRQGAFTLAGRLYGITFTELKDMPVYQKDVRCFEVKEQDGRHLGLIYVDYHPRPGKRGGAWMSSYRQAWVKDGKQVDPVVVNVCNFTAPAGDRPALLTSDEVRTLFHEFGHGLHGLFYKGRYRGTAGTPRDFVELPSQVMENWSMEPEMLKLYAKHYKTGVVIPDALVAKMKKAATFGQGFATVEYMAASLLDMDWHTLTTTKPQDTAAFEKASLAKWGLIAEIPPRYRSPYFNHIMGGYAAGYYSYIWSAVLDSDAFQAFKEKGNLFDPATAAKFRAEVLSKGGTEDPALLYRRFRGRDPKVGPLLEKRGLK
ncbi:M3 family metallopeptidase [Geothrix edaphica]|uniref:Dipeptidyl carboxypeptidase II n=1 Tax=Geothrix edaphica TaxID=2927976 RepID=A0ABQ5Q0X1_9BACT|nr:M3 family metallopeptidase [Geothrix edaphica]GLH68046.1 dipeptidyl carboxypeptidase II [Geothrix edaphica]